MSHWEQVKTEGDVYYDLWNKFWGKSLEFERDVTVASVADDEESMAVDKSFKVLTIDARLPHLVFTEGRLVVRQEYLDAVVRLNDQNEAWPKTGAVVIGHPGIGKSWFLYYLLVLRLSEKKKTLLNLNPSDPIHLFDSSGYYKFRGRDTGDLYVMARDAWALLDTPTHNVNPHPFLTSPQYPVFMVFACSPSLNRYKDYKKQNRAMNYVMGNWSFDEIWAGATLRPAGKVDQKTLYGYYTKFGPSARTMYELYDGVTTVDELDETINTALEGITPERLQELVSEAKGHLEGLPYKQNISHAVILASPNPKNRAMLHGEIITRYVFQRLAERLFQNDILALIRTYKLFANSKLAELGPTCGWLFEHYCHHMLSKHVGRQLKLTPLEATRTTQRQRGGEKVTFKICHPKPQASESKLTLTKRELYFFNVKESLTLSDSKYFLPFITNNPAYDGLMTCGDQAFAFQITVSFKHDVVQSGINDLRNRINNRPLNYILLAPEDTKVEIHLDMPETIYEGPQTKFYLALVEVRATANPEDVRQS